MPRTVKQQQQPRWMALCSFLFTAVLDKVQEIKQVCYRATMLFQSSIFLLLKTTEMSKNKIKPNPKNCINISTLRLKIVHKYTHNSSNHRKRGALAFG